MKVVFPSVKVIEIWIAWKRALRSALAVGPEKEGELVTRALEFEYLHWESRCEMLIGRDDISSEVIYRWLVFFNVCLHSHSFPFRADWWKSDSSVDGEPQGNCRWNSNSRDVIASSPSFSHPATRVPWRACLQTKGRREHATQYSPHSGSYGQWWCMMTRMQCS